MDRQPGVGPRFKDKRPEDYPVPTLNPYVAGHRELPEVVPASDAPGFRGRWGAAFGREAPLHLEVGSGNGFYLSGMAARHPEVNWLGLEIRFKRVVLAAKKIQAAALPNARVVRYDAFVLGDLFTPQSLAGVHVNHPDPWPKRATAHRRLVGRAFLEMVTPLVVPGGELRLKTDFAPHVAALLEALDGLPWIVRGVRTDVRAQGAPWGEDVVTNYQRKFDERSLPVHAAWLLRLDRPPE